MRILPEMHITITVLMPLIYSKSQQVLCSIHIFQLLSATKQRGAHDYESKNSLRVITCTNAQAEIVESLRIKRVSRLEMNAELGQHFKPNITPYRGICESYV